MEGGGDGCVGGDGSYEESEGYGVGREGQLFGVRSDGQEGEMSYDMLDGGRASMRNVSSRRDTDMLS